MIAVLSKFIAYDFKNRLSIESGIYLSVDKNCDDWVKSQLIEGVLC